MKKILYVTFFTLFLSACNGPMDLPSDGELEDLIAESIEKEVAPIGFINLFSNKKSGENSKICEFKKLENLKRADWQDDKQKFKADVSLHFFKGMNFPSIDFKGLFDDGDIKVETNEKEREMTVEVQGYLFKDEFDEWVVEFVD